MHRPRLFFASFLFLFLLKGLPSFAGIPTDTLPVADMLPLRNWSFWNKDLSSRELDELPGNGVRIQLPMTYPPEGVKAWTGKGSLLKKVYVPKELVGVRFSIQLEQWGASELWVDGKRIGALGKVGDQGEEVRRIGQMTEKLQLTFDTSGLHCLRIRFSDQHWQAEKDMRPSPFYGIFDLTLKGWEASAKNDKKKAFGDISLIAGVVGILLALGFVHLLLFLFEPLNRTHLFYALFMGFFSLFLYFLVQRHATEDPSYFIRTAYWMQYLFYFLLLGLLTLFYSLFSRKGFNILYWSFWGVAGLCFVTGRIGLFGISENMYAVLFSLIVLIECCRRVVQGLRRGDPGSWVLGMGMGLFVSIPIGKILFDLALKGVITYDMSSSLSLFWMNTVPLSMSVYLARNFSLLRKSLREKLEEVRDLSQKNLEQEREKQRILENKKEELEEKVQERTKELQDQKRLVEEKQKETEEQKKQVEEAHQEITDSIYYARRIQEAILPDPERYELLRDHFVFFRPRDPVSGDFHWIRKEKGHIYVAAVDCTGHGVPGAFMSMLGVSFLNEILANRPGAEPGEILTRLKERVVKELSGRKGTAKDGMDAAMLKIPDPNSQNPKPKEGIEVAFAGANNPLYWVRREESELPDGLSEDQVKSFKDHPEGVEIKGDKGAIGYEEHGGVAEFETLRFKASPADALYIFSDGYADQFGGPKGKKFRYGSLKRQLAELAPRPMNEQKEEVERRFEEWKGDREQIDDVLLIGVRV